MLIRHTIMFISIDIIKTPISIDGLNVLNNIKPKVYAKPGTILAEIWLFFCFSQLENF